MSYDIGLRIGIDGEAGYKQALKTINGELRNVGQELRAVTKEFEGNANSIDALTAKNRVLEKEVELHRVKVELLSKEYKNQTDELKKLEQKLEETKKAHSEDSEEVKKAQKEYDTQASKVRKLDSDIGTATATLNRYTKEMDANTTSIKDQSSETGKLEKELGDLKSEMGLLESDQKKLTSSFKLQAAEMGENATEAEKLELSQRQLKEQMELTDKVVKNLESQLEKAKQAYGENSKEVKDLETKLNNAKTEIVQVNNKLNDMDTDARSAGDGVNQLNQNVQSLTLFEMAEALQEVSDKLIKLGQKAIDAFIEYDSGMDIIVTKTGATGDALTGFKTVYDQVTSSMYTQTFDDVGSAIGELNTQFGLSGDALTAASEYMLMFAEINGTDVTSASIAAKQAIEAYGLSNEDLNFVLDSVTTTAQGTGQSVDSLFEKAVDGAPQIKALGLSFDEGVQLMGDFEKAGVDSSGMLDGLSRATMNYAEDGKTLTAGLKETQDAILGASDETEALNYAQEAFGDRATPKMVEAIRRGVLNLEDLATVSEDTTGTVSETFEATLSPMDKFKQMGTELTKALEPLGNAIAETASPLIDTFAPLLGSVSEAFSGLPQSLQTLLVVIGGILTGFVALMPIIAIFTASFNTLAPIIAGIAGSAGGLGGVFAAITGPVGIAIAAVAGVIAVFKGAWDHSMLLRNNVRIAFMHIKSAIVESMEKIKEAFAPVIETFKSFRESTGPVLQEIGDYIGQKIIPKLVEFGTMLIDVFTNVIIALAPVFSAIGNLFSVISNFVGMVFALFRGDWAQAGEFAKNVGQSLLDFLSNIFQALLNVLTLIITAIKDNMQQKWQEVHDGVVSILTAIGDFLRNAWQSIYDNTIGKLIETATGIAQRFSEIRSDAESKWEEIKQTIIDKIKGLPDTLKGFAVDMLNKIADGIRETSQSAWDAMTDFANDLKDKFKEALGIHSPSTEFFGYGKNIVQGLIDGLNIDSVMGWVNSMIEQIKGAFAGGNFNLQAAIEFIGTGAADFFKSIGIGGAKTGDMAAPVSGDITSEFGWRTHPIYGDQRFHSGIDIGAAEGTPVGAAGTGTVTQAGWNGGYGMSVTLDHGNGLSSLYAHLSAILVSVGEVVSKLQTIGLVGSTGDSTGAHLHFGLMENGEWIDPSELFGFDVGSRYIPQDMVALVHEGEMIVPRSENPYANSSGQIMPESTRSSQPLIIQVTLGNGKILAEALIDNLDDLIGIKTGMKARGMA
ncbi:MAG: hypothetical protein PWQ06_107 [Anaerophaga sp.]|nr:hypothetical protein [Anaerophaga sp.]